MDFFAYRDGRLLCESVDLADVAEAHGTPVYVYSTETLLHHYRLIAEAFEMVCPTICFSIKSLSNIHVLRVLREAGSGFDVVSGGELARALAAGADPSKIVYAGVGKTDREINEAIAAGIGLFNVESEAEFENLSALTAAAGGKVRAALRVNPDIDPQTHRYTTTGKKETKFGVDIERAVRFFQRYGRDPNVRLDAVHIHIGSPIYTPDPYTEAITKTLALIAQLRAEGFSLRTLDIGGGFAADYEEGRSPAPVDYAVEIVPLLKGADLEIILEPGRQIACNAGILLTKVLYVKTGGERNFAIVDAAMTDLIRPALYDAEHFMYPTVIGRQEEPPRQIHYVPEGGVRYDVVGGVCETGDFLGKDRVLPELHRGDLLAIFSAGAYGFSMASQYNSRPRAPEVLVKANTYRLIRRRETYDDLLAPERGL